MCVYAKTPECVNKIHNLFLSFGTTVRLLLPTAPVGGAIVSVKKVLLIIRHEFGQCVVNCPIGRRVVERGSTRHTFGGDLIKTGAAHRMAARNL
jgi:hypothetical protein